MPRIDPIIGSRDFSKQPSLDNPIIYAVGDICGCVQELAVLRRKIVEEAAQHRDQERLCRVIYLGNYVGNNAFSADVIDLFVSTPLKDLQEIFLLGQNDWAFSNFAFGRSFSAEWICHKGGASILKSYDVPVDDFHPLDFSGLRNCLLKKMPPDHLEFLKTLGLSESHGHYFFSHAGVNPDRSLAKQTPTDLITPNSKFMQTKRSFEQIIVHGHYEMLMPSECHNRISLNTACDKTGVLTSLCISEHGHRFIQASAQDMPALSSTKEQQRFP